MFYLMSRGLDDETARGTLVRAFAAEIIDTVKIKASHSFLDRVFTKAVSRPASEEAGMTTAKRAVTGPAAAPEARLRRRASPRRFPHSRNERAWQAARVS